jgi:hypothetical protein
MSTPIMNENNIIFNHILYDNYAAYSKGSDFFTLYNTFNDIINVNPYKNKFIQIFNTINSNIYTQYNKIINKYYDLYTTINTEQFNNHENFTSALRAILFNSAVWCLYYLTTNAA